MRRYIRVLAFILAFMGTIAMMGICAYAAEEETPAAEPAPRSPTAALWAGFRREEPLLCLTADARQIARTMWQEGGHLCP